MESEGVDEYVPLNAMRLKAPPSQANTSITVASGDNTYYNKNSTAQ
jgi:hypothetical protein